MRAGHDPALAILRSFVGEYELAAQTASHANSRSICRIRAKTPVRNMSGLKTPLPRAPVVCAKRRRTEAGPLRFLG